MDTSASVVALLAAYRSKPNVSGARRDSQELSGYGQNEPSAECSGPSWWEGTLGWVARQRPRPTLKQGGNCWVPTADHGT